MVLDVIRLSSSGNGGEGKGEAFKDQSAMESKK